MATCTKSTRTIPAEPLRLRDLQVGDTFAVHPDFHAGDERFLVTQEGPVCTRGPREGRFAPFAPTIPVYRIYRLGVALDPPMLKRQESYTIELSLEEATDLARVLGRSNSSEPGFDTWNLLCALCKHIPSPF